MGNQTNKKFEWDTNFTVLQRNFNDNTLIVQKHNDGKQYIAREIISSDIKQSEQIKRLIKIKYHNNNPFLTKLADVFYNKGQAYCSPQDKIHLTFEKPKQTLRQQILARKFANQPFTEEQADVILQSGVKAIRALKQIGHPHNNVSTSSIFINEDRRILLGDPWITPPVYSQDINQNVFACPSPQKILLQNDQVMSICPYRSDLFSLGTVILQALNFQHMDILYEKGFRRLVENRVKQKLSKINNEQLRYKLSIVLSHDPFNREQIYKMYRTPGFQVSHVKNNLVKQLRGHRIIEGSTVMTKNKQKIMSPIIQLNRMTSKSAAKQQTHQNQNAIRKLAPSSNMKQTYAYGGNPIPNTNITHYGRPIQSSRIQNLINPIVHPVGYNNISPNVNFVPPNNGFIYNNTRLPEIKQPLYSAPPTRLFQEHVSINPTTFAVNNNAKLFNFPPSGTQSSSPVQISRISKNRTENDSFQPTTNNFQPLMIRKSDQFVKTSGNIRYIQHDEDKRNLNEQSIEKSDNCQILHIGNYAVKPTSYGLVNKTDSIDLPSEKQQIVQTNMQRKTGSQGSGKQYSDYIKENQNKTIKVPEKYTRQLKLTPERRPNRKYNSTIKEDSEENSYSGSRDNDEYEYVIEDYEAGRYDGQKKNQMRNGFGKFYYNEGSVYEGNWKDNLMHGKGNLYYSNGKLAYEGDWRMDEFHGQGKVYNQDQLQIKGSYDYTDFTDVNEYWASYEGELNSDRRHGKGKIKFSNGEIFVGNFITDTVQGQGKFYTLNGDIIHGIWRNNKLAKRI